MKRRFFIQTVLMSSGTILIGNQKFMGKSNSGSPIKVTMIYNNIGANSQLSSKWGLSLVVEYNEDALLFDTGGEPEVLWDNMQKISFDINKISNVVISHNHWDHVNGLDAIIEQSNVNPEVYVPEYNLEDIKHNFEGANLIGVNDPVQINEVVWTTGQLTGDYKTSPIYEQSIIIVQGESIFLFTGCSHPGIVKIVEKTKGIFPDKDLKLVAGGFHMVNYTDQEVKESSEKLKKLNVAKISPSHCTGEKAIQIFKEEWKDNFMDFDIENNQLMV